MTYSDLQQSEQRLEQTLADFFGNTDITGLMRTCQMVSKIYSVTCHCLQSDFFAQNNPVEQPAEPYIMALYGLNQNTLDQIGNHYQALDYSIQHLAKLLQSTPQQVAQFESQPELMEKFQQNKRTSTGFLDMLIYDDCGGDILRDLLQYCEARYHARNHNTP